MGESNEKSFYKGLVYGVSIISWVISGVITYVVMGSMPKNLVKQLEKQTYLTFVTLIHFKIKQIVMLQE
jgi:hypothetical protein